MERHFQLNWQSFVQEAIQKRKEQRLTQAHLAVLSGVSKPTIVAFEHGKTSLKLETALKILSTLGMAKI